MLCVQGTGREFKGKALARQEKALALLVAKAPLGSRILASIPKAFGSLLGFITGGLYH